MAVFTLDMPEDKYEGGGFNEASFDEMAAEDEREGEAPEKPEDETKPDGTDAKTDKPDDADDKPTDDAEEEETPEPKAKPKSHAKAAYDFLLAQNAKTAAELAQIRQKEAPAEAEYPTEEDFARDPAEASRRIVQIERQKERQAESEQAEKSLKATQNQVWGKLTQAVPGLGTDQTMRARWANIFYSNPEYQRMADGPLRAARDMAKIFYNEQTENTEAQTQGREPPDTTQAPTGENRQQKLKAGAMHGSGKGGGKQSVKKGTGIPSGLLKSWGLTEADIKAVDNG